MIEAGKSIDLLEMREIQSFGSKNIRILEEQELRKRGNTTEKYFQKKDCKICQTFEIQSFDWLSDKYILLYGLRKWTWRVIIEGIIAENMLEFEDD